MSRKTKVFIDTNVLLDVLSEERRSSSDASDLIFQAIKSGLLEGELSTQSFLDASYIICRGRNSALLSEKLLQLMDFINMGAIDSSNIREAIAASRGDFEDDAQYACAMDGGCDFFLTNDRTFIKKYEGEKQPIQFFTPEEFLARLQA